MADDHYEELDELQVLEGIKSGELLVRDRYVKSELVARGLIHRSQKQSFLYLECGEEERIRSLC